MTTQHETSSDMQKRGHTSPSKSMTIRHGLDHELAATCDTVVTTSSPPLGEWDIVMQLDGNSNRPCDCSFVVEPLDAIAQSLSAELTRRGYVAASVKLCVS
jgi:hypothetical protein